MIRYHGDIYVESAPEDNKNAIFLNVGYHVRGSAQRLNSSYNGTTGMEVPARTYYFTFHNLSMSIGGKQKFESGPDKWMYYSLGIRGDVNLGVDLDLYPQS